MVQDSLPSDGTAPRSIAGACRRRLPLIAGLGAILGLAGLGSLSYSGKAPPVAIVAGLEKSEPTVVAAVPANDETAPRADANELWQSALLDSLPQPPAVAPDAALEPPAPPTEAEATPSPEPQAPTPLVQTVPLPMPRPPELRTPNATPPTRRAERPAPRRIRNTAVQAPREDTRSFFDKLFGVERSASPALAYTSLDSTGSIDTAPRAPRLSPLPAPPAPNPGAGGGTAVYDITARIVTMPNGEKLEAHSGSGATMDDPRYVHLPMRGATPPGTYDLTQRETPFHGVQALRMTPIGGSASIHGRVGILAHSYLRGPSGASSGCVAFRNYDRFLQAYLRGEVQRIVVVTGRGQDVLPSVVDAIFGTPARSARAGSNT